MPVVVGGGGEGWRTRHEREWMWDQMAWVHSSIVVYVWIWLGCRCVMHRLDHSKRDLTDMNAHGKIMSPRMC